MSRGIRRGLDTEQELFAPISSIGEWQEFADSPYRDREMFLAARNRPETMVEDTLQALCGKPGWNRARKHVLQNQRIIQACSRQILDGEMPEFIERSSDDVPCLDRGDAFRRLRKREWYEVVNYKAELVDLSSSGMNGFC